MSLELKTGLNVNVVFVGLEKSSVDEALFRSILPLYYTPVLRMSNIYLGSYAGNPPVYLGLDFTLDYSILYAEEWFEPQNPKVGRKDLDPLYCEDPQPFPEMQHKT